MKKVYNLKNKKLTLEVRKTTTKEKIIGIVGLIAIGIIIYLIRR